jgi:hypothetical protein
MPTAISNNQRQASLLQRHMHGACGEKLVFQQSHRRLADMPQSDRPTRTAWHPKNDKNCPIRKQRGESGK